MDPYLCKSIDISSFEACSINDSRFPPYKYNLFCQMVNYSSYKTSVNHLVYRNESKKSTFTTSKSTKFNILFEAALILTSKDIIWSLTATGRVDSRLPKSSKMLITAEISMIAQKLLKRLPLKFKDESFGAIKMSQKIFSTEI